MLITDLKQMEGKTIERVAVVDLESTLGLVFTDGYCAFIESAIWDYGDYAQPRVICSPGEHILRELGVDHGH